MKGSYGAVVSAAGKRHHELIAQAERLDPIRTAVVHPVDVASLEGAAEAQQAGLIRAVPVGPEQKIRSAAEQAGVKLSNCELVAVEHSHAAADKTVAHRAVRGGDEFNGPALVDRAVPGALEWFVPLAPTQPALERTYALPRELSASGVRRYGFHGLSYEYIAGVLPKFVGESADGRVVIADLGHGASLRTMRGRHTLRIVRAIPSSGDGPNRSHVLA